MNKRYKFKEDEEVAHIDNLEHKIIISRILKESTTYPTGEYDEHGVSIRKPGIKMIGIECEWWEGKILRTHKFHSRRLVPWNIVIQGKETINDWLRSQDRIV